MRSHSIAWKDIASREGAGIENFETQPEAYRAYKELCAREPLETEGSIELFYNGDRQLRYPEDHRHHIIGPEGVRWATVKEEADLKDRVANSVQESMRRYDKTLKKLADS